MAIYHLCTKIIGRSCGRTATAAAAYRAGIRIRDTRTGILFDYSRRKNVCWRAIAAPDHAPEWALSREQLWNAVELAEKRGDAQLAREVEISLPLELSYLERLALIAEFVDATFVKHGMVADITVHDNQGNPHVHILLTMRELLPDGFGKKVREWNDKQRLEAWRQAWAAICNRALAKSGHRSRIDHRSLTEQGISRPPTRHKGPNRKAKIRKEIARQQQSIETPRLPSGWTNAIGAGGSDEKTPLPKTLPACVTPLDPVLPILTRKPLNDGGYQEKLRAHFGERLHATRYNENPPSLDIQIKGASLRDHGDRITAKFGGFKEEAEAIVELAQVKGWKSIHVQGNDEFRRSLWREASRRGYSLDAIKGYEPTAEDFEILKKTRERTQGDGSKPVQIVPNPDALHPLNRHRFRR